jgi:predicted membrane protein
MNDERPQDETRDRKAVVVGLSLSDKDRHSTLIGGLLVIGFGVLLLLDQEGIISFEHVLRFWPLLLIVPGLVKLFQGRVAEERVLGAVLTFFGLLFLFSALGFRHFEFRHLWPLVVIALGAWMLFAPPKELRPRMIGRLLSMASSESELNSINVFGGGESRITSRNFRGGKLVAFFGGFKLDMSEADMEGNEAVIDLTAFFGGGEFIIPRAWEISVRGTGLFGGFGNETRHFPESGAPKKTLVIRGTWVFGGFNVKN